MTDTLGLMLFVVIHGADLQDRDGAPEVLKAIRYRFPWLRHVFAKPAPDLIRGRLCRAKAAGSAQRARRLDHRHHQALRHRQGLRGAAPEVGCRANPGSGPGQALRMARALQTPRKGLGGINRKLNSLGFHIKHQVDDTTSRKVLLCRMNF